MLIFASDVASIIGFNEIICKHELLSKIHYANTGHRLYDVKESWTRHRAREHGMTNEPKLYDLYTQYTNNEILIKQPAYALHTSKCTIIGTPDALTPNKVVEFKSRTRPLRKFKEPRRSDTIQCLMYMRFTNIPTADIFEEYKGDIHLTTIVRNDYIAVTDEYIAKIHDFCDAYNTWTQDLIWPFPTCTCYKYSFMQTARCKYDRV